MGVLPSNEPGKKSRYNCKKYEFFLDAPFEISNRCCYIMKKAPAHTYQHKEGRHPMLASMAEESWLRRQGWLQRGCNGFDMAEPTSNPMAFWTEQDVLQYIVESGLPICSVYGSVVTTESKKGACYETTGCYRTGCMFCGFGCHREKKGEGRFVKMKKTHPKQWEWMLSMLKNNGVSYKEAIDWINEHGNLQIEY